MAEESGMAVAEENGVERDTSLNIWQRINAVMADVGGHIEKAGLHEIKKDGRKVGEFNYITHDDVTEHIRKSLVKHGVVVMPTVADKAINGNRTELTVQVDFVNIDSPDDRVSIQSVGYGVDNSDKGPGKAWSYAVKYAYLKMFMLNSADDIEADDVQHETDSAKLALTDAQERINELDKTALQNLKTAIINARSTEEIDGLMKDNKTVLKSAPDVTQTFFNDLANDTKKELENAQ